MIVAENDPAVILARVREPKPFPMAAVPVFSSGQTGLVAAATHAAVGTTDLIFAAGGGIFGHPGGVAAGVTALRPIEENGQTVDGQLAISKLVTTATSVDLKGLDHQLGWHPDRESSLRDYGVGRFEPAILRATIEFIDRIAKTK